MTVNKLVDFVERVAWTFVQTFLGTLIALDLTGSVDWSEVLYASLIAGGIAAAKVVIAQNFIGENGAGDLLPGAESVEVK
jgi:hypothetical protein